MLGTAVLVQILQFVASSGGPCLFGDIVVGIKKLELLWPFKLQALEGAGDDLVVEASPVVCGQDDRAGANEF